MSSMFSTNVVGLANGVVAGWGNLGGGATHLLMPHICSLIHHLGKPEHTAWRIAFFLPAVFQSVIACVVLYCGQDLPEGNFKQLQNSGKKPRDKLWRVVRNGVRNYRAWILALTYGYSFGVELTIDNIIAVYFYDRFEQKLSVAGMIAASFGLANLVSRPAGGFFSDYIVKRFGMRGRLWSLWIVQTVGGLLCVLLGRMKSLKASIAVMALFSFFVQAACGLTMGIVPFVSRRYLGVTSGMVGGGGNVGAVLTQLIFFRGSKFSVETGITLMGIMIICCTLPVWFIYFPQWGGMCCGPSTDESATEEKYYLSEWSPEEVEAGLHEATMAFAANSRNERSGRQGSTSATPTGNATNSD